MNETEIGPRTTANATGLTLFGLTFIVHPVDKFKIKLKDGISVVALEETVKFCKKNEYVYRPALEYLDKKYKLHIIKNYEQVSS